LLVRGYKPSWRIKAALVEKIYAHITANPFAVKKENSYASIII
jgi:hypothetical protein